ncbi:VOC family protein [Mariniblastus fucicola]|uniref:Glyoxalase-like domain protein n=1 Tax=Mariniblastus fucicola TaxID=980251 RepID=A0A5B9P6F3_9BACT|nr:VOC family protein [Mariniblastus fucicola]QEG21854.1 Glyoxalase-like domain protein [Mariniblastus fucicola]
MLANPVGWFEIYVDDLDRATRFYESVLATTLQNLDSPGGEIRMMAFPMDPDRKGASGAIVKVEGVSSGGNSVLVYFSCEDCAVEESRVESAGGKIHKSKFSIGPYGFITLAVDSEGNMFGLHSQR